MEERSISFRGALTERIYVDALWHHRGRVLRRFAAVALAGSMVFGVWGWFAAPRTQYVLILAFLVLWASLVPTLAKRAFRQSFHRAPILQRPYEGTISSERLAITSETGNLHMRWPEFCRVDVHADMIVAYAQPGLFYIVASECFATPADWEDAVKLVRSATSAPTKSC